MSAANYPAKMEPTPQHKHLTKLEQECQTTAPWVCQRTYAEPNRLREQYGRSFSCGVRQDAERPELRHAGPNDVNREAELDRPSRVACSDLLDHTVILQALLSVPQ